MGILETVRKVIDTPEVEIRAIALCLAKQERSGLTRLMCVKGLVRDH